MSELIELRESLATALHKVDDIIARETSFGDNFVTQPRIRRMQVEPLMTKICEYYGLREQDFMSVSARSKISDKKKVACKVLRELGAGQGNDACTLKRISKLMGYSTHRSVINNIDIMDIALSGSHYGYKELADDYKELRKFIGR